MLKVYVERRTCALMNLRELADQAMVQRVPDERAWLEGALGSSAPPLQGLLPHLFARIFHGRKLKPEVLVCQAPATVRIASRALPRSLAGKLPRFPKTCLEGVAALPELAQCRTKEEVAAVVTLRPGLQWNVVEWQKPADRGIVLILQGLERPEECHFWSCADKPPKVEGRFFKECTEDATARSLKDLANNIGACEELCLALVAERGKFVKVPRGAQGRGLWFAVFS